MGVCSSRERPESQAQEEEPQRVYDVVVLGPHESGKTAAIRFLQRVFKTGVPSFGHPKPIRVAVKHQLFHILHHVLLGWDSGDFDKPALELVEQLRVATRREQLEEKELDLIKDICEKGLVEPPCLYFGISRATERLLSYNRIPGLS
jgi:hypothetical protein